MILLQITKADADQRLDKYLKRRLHSAPSGFIYKMLRKKNIRLNGMRASGSELLREKDEVKLFISDETYDKFSKSASSEEAVDIASYQKAYRQIGKIEIVFENEHILILNKPSGILSQKAAPGDLSANEWLIGYLLETGFVSEDTLPEFKPSVCNRLDRNTSGLLACGKTLPGSRYLSGIIKDKSLEKYYYALVAGNVLIDRRVSGWLCKNTKTNKAVIYQKASEVPASLKEKAQYTDTAFKTVKTTAAGNATLLEARLFTGKTHQIRAQLSAMGYPIIGDVKYGGDTSVRSQLLHAYKLVFPKTGEQEFSDISGMTLTCGLPRTFERIMGERF
ncbi:MAG: RluA family pseudouridine synthase [Lachnospiraceae bacterium]|nr:RluA family pseudouridine synthase [Lachnospiraceae bacterium]